MYVRVHYAEADAGESLKYVRPMSKLRNTKHRVEVMKQLYTNGCSSRHKTGTLVRLHSCFCSLPISPLMCSAVQGAPGKDGRDGLPGRDGPTGPPGAPGIAAFDVTAIRDQIRDEVLRDIDSKLSQSKRNCHNLGHISQPPRHLVPRGL